jgi:sigma-B regulation protein RsbU (phosphoserine phosphatase)
VVGLFPGQTYTSETLELPPGATLLLYTDGVTEAGNVSQELFGDARLHACFADGGEKTARGSVERLMRHVREFATGAAQSDDITILALRRAGGEA